MGPALCWVMLGPLPLAGTSFAGSAHLGLSPVESRETLEDPRESQVVHTFERYARDLERGKLPDLPGPATLRVLTGMLEDPQWVPEVVGPLLDIFGMVEATAGDPLFRVGAGGTSTKVLKGLVRRALGRKTGSSPLINELSFGVVLDKKKSISRRKTAMGLLQDQGLSAGRQCLLTLGRDAEDPLRSEALMNAAGWTDPALDRMLVALLTGPQIIGLVHPTVPLLRRTQAGRRPLGKRACKDLEPLLVKMMAGPNWRDSVRGIQLSRGFAPEERVALLIDGMLVWDQRKRAKIGSRRVTRDYSQALSLISGRSIGSNPRNWIQWWVSVRQGKIPMHKAADSSQGPRTRASFFGLDIEGDRVTFVLDKSGSMGSETSSGITRYELALEQLFSALDGLGEDVQFKVILFSSGPPVDSGEMVAATPKNINRLRKSLSSREPGGGTNLQPAIQRALGHGASGEIDPEACEPDTVVVLCDGATSSGRSWVKPYLERLLPVLQVRFYCVLLGGGGDGTLDLLAEHSGGQIVSPGDG